MKRNRPLVDWIQFDSLEEVEVYSALKNGTLDKLSNIKELKWAKLINARPSSITLCDGFKAWWKTIKKRVYTHDFDIKIWKKNILLEVKSKWSEAKPDYRLRRFLFLFLFHKKYNFAELIKERKWVWKYIEYF